jgi:hypothetical protein
MNQGHYSPDGRKPPLYCSIAWVSAYEEQVASPLPQHDSDHPDSTTRAIWWQSRRITGEKQTQYQTTSLFSTAYGVAATTATAQSSFTKAGFWPVKADIGYVETSRSLSQKPPTGLSQIHMETSTAMQDQARMTHALLLHILS